MSTKGTESTTTSTAISTTTVVSTTTTTSTESAPQTLTVVGSASAGSQFDQALILVTAQAQNRTLQQGVQTIQKAVTKVTSFLGSSELTNVRANPGTFFIVSPTIYFANVTTVTVEEQISFTVTSSDPKILINESSMVVDAVQKAGLVAPSSTTGGVEIFLQFSQQLKNQLTAQAFNDAVRNATSNANNIAKAQGLQIIGTSQVVQVANQQSQQPSSLLSLFLSLYGGSGGIPTQTVDVTVQVTFLVQKS